MFDPSLIGGFLQQSSPEELQAALKRFLPENATRAERISAIETALHSPIGQLLRTQFGNWIVDRFIPAVALVPEEYAKWRPPVRDAMTFFGTRICDARLAPKILAQMDLPVDTPPEIRLLNLISKVPGLQKLGQVLARNRHIRPSLRHALTQLENGIRDVTAEEMRALVEQQLGERLDRFQVKIEPAILSEASVSAVVRFTWRNPASDRRERGVFKILKPYIPGCFAEDMDILHGLAEFFGTRYREYGFAKHVLTDTFNKVRRLLRHEVDFVGEQRTLLEAYMLYRSMPGVRVPQVIQPLCTPTITALTEEFGVKVTQAVARLPAWRRGQVAEQLIEALIAVPLFASEESALFHADPHAGNLLYNERTRELVILDWALTERLSREQRRHMALLVFMVGLRDPLGSFNEVRALSEPMVRRNSKQAQVIRSLVAEFIDEIPLKSMPGAVDAMRLLQLIAVKGIRFPAPLIMLSKVLFTLDGILQDIGGSGASMALSIARHPFRRWLASGARPGLPLTVRDWAAVQCSAAFVGGRLSIKLEEELLERLLPRRARADLSVRDHSNGGSTLEQDGPQ
jgi:ubiquinone biosynthesis protein